MCTCTQWAIRARSELSPVMHNSMMTGPAFVLDPGVWLFLIALMGFSNANTLTIRVIDENDFDAVIVAFPVYDLNGVPEGHLITVTVPSGASLQLQYMPSAPNRSFANEALGLLGCENRHIS